jgi:hypothetical protein
MNPPPSSSRIMGVFWQGISASQGTHRCGAPEEAESEQDRKDKPDEEPHIAALHGVSPSRARRKLSSLFRQFSQTGLHLLPGRHAFSCGRFSYFGHIVAGGLAVHAPVADLQMRPVLGPSCLASWPRPLPPFHDSKSRAQPDDNRMGQLLLSGAEGKAPNWILAPPQRTDR